MSPDSLIGPEGCCHSPSAASDDTYRALGLVGCELSSDLELTSARSGRSVALGQGWSLGGSFVLTTVQLPSEHHDDGVVAVVIGNHGPVRRLVSLHSELWLAESLPRN